MPVMPAPTTSTSTAMSSFNAENRGAGALSIQYELVSMFAIGRQDARRTPDGDRGSSEGGRGVGGVGRVGRVGKIGTHARGTDCDHKPRQASRDSAHFEGRSVRAEDARRLFD